jgi:hypothetical protein
VLHKRCRWPAFALLLLTALPTLFADPAPEEPPSLSPQISRAEDKKATPTPSSVPKKVEPFKPPPDAVLIIASEVAEGIKAQSVRMTPEKYQELLDEIARLKALLRADKPVLPSKCQIKGKIDGELALLQAQFEFVTETPNTIVLLGGAPAQPSGVQLDGRTGLFKAEANGFSIQVEKPGDHQLILDLTVGLSGKGNDRGFELELPRAAITNLNLALPDNVKDVRVGGKPFADAWLTLKNGELAGPLGPIEKLDVKWRKPGAGADVPAVLTATARIFVQLEERETKTRAELTLKSEGGPTAVWPLLVPRGALVELSKEDKARLLNSIGTAEQTYALRTIRLKEPVAELHVTVTVSGPPPRAGTLTAVGPFALQNALRQSGEITVTNNLADVILEYHPRGDVEPAGGSGAFRYASLMLPPQPQAAPGAGSLSLLDVEPRSTRGLVETKVLQDLTLKVKDAHSRAWRVKTTIIATMFRTGVDHIDVQMPLPSECVYVESLGPSSAGVRKTELDATAHVLRFWLAADPPKSFQIEFESEYQLSVTDAGKATFVFPKPLDTRDPGAGHKVTVSVPNDLELLPGQATAFEPRSQELPQKQEWLSSRIPEQLDVAWQRYRPQRVTSVVDLTLTAHEGKVTGRVQQLFRFYFPGSTPSQVLLRLPDGTPHPKMVGGMFAPATNNGEAHLIKLTSLPDKDQAHALQLEYTFPVPETAETFLVPLATPEEIAGGDIKVRVWTEPGLVPSLIGNSWSDAAIEDVPEMRRLPILVARTQQLGAPLRLRFSDSGSPASAVVLVDRVLVRVSIGDGGLQTYRVSYLLTQLGARSLKVELPAPIPSLNLRVLLDNKEVPVVTLDDSDRRSDGGRIAQLSLVPQLVRKPTVLEVSYQLQAQRTGSGSLRTTLQPPLLRGDAGRPPTRWQITLADGPNLVVLWPDGGPGAEPVWGRRGWLFGPGLALTSTDLDRWFAGNQELPPTDDNEVSLPVSASCWRQGVEPLTLVHVPQRVWLLTCSLAFLAVGYLLFLRAWRRGDTPATIAGWFWGFLALVPVAVLIGMFFQPTLAAAIVYGCLPGAFVLLLIVVVHLIVQERRRRQIVFLPSFRRSGSSLIRNQKAARHGEPSTVDVPRPSGSQWPAIEGPQPESKSGSKAG